MGIGSLKEISYFESLQMRATQPSSKQICRKLLPGVDHAGELLGEICLAIEMGCDAEDLALTIHAHPTLHESIGLAAELFEGSITDLPNPKTKKPSNA